MTALYKAQFVEDFWPEQAAVDALQDNGWTDVSYGNDSCPSWQWGRYKVYVDAADPNKRDFPSLWKLSGGFGFRFNLYKDDDLITESNYIDDVIEQATWEDKEIDRAVLGKKV